MGAAHDPGSRRRPRCLRRSGEVPEYPRSLCPEGESESAVVSMEEKGVEFAFTAVKGVAVREHTCAVLTERRSHRQRTLLVDSGASCHICNDVTMVSDFRRTSDE